MFICRNFKSRYQLHYSVKSVIFLNYFLLKKKQEIKLCMFSKSVGFTLYIHPGKSPWKHLESDDPFKKTPPKVIWQTYDLTHSKQNNQIFLWQFSLVGRGWGFLMVRGPSRHAWHAIVLNCKKHLYYRENPSVLFLVALLMWKCHPIMMDLWFLRAVCSSCFLLCLQSRCWLVTRCWDHLKTLYVGAFLQWICTRF